MEASDHDHQQQIKKTSSVEQSTWTLAPGTTTCMHMEFGLRILQFCSGTPKFFE
jgi:hypothetical protein